MQRNTGANRNFWFGQRVLLKLYRFEVYFLKAFMKQIRSALIIGSFLKQMYETHCKKLEVLRMIVLNQIIVILVLKLTKLSELINFYLSNFCNFEG